MSISAIFPCLTVKPMTECGCPPGATTTPAPPFTSAGRTGLIPPWTYLSLPTMLSCALSITWGAGAQSGDDDLGAALRAHLIAERGDGAAEAAHECRDVRAAGIGPHPACRLGPPEELVGGRVERFEGGAQPGKGARPAGHHLGQ